MGKTLARITWIGAFLSMLLCSNVWAIGPSVAFFYGKPIPPELFTHFDWVVVEADNLDDQKRAKEGSAEIFAYVSVGEIESWRPRSAPIEESWILGTNQGWSNDIVDLSQTGWQNYLLEERMASLWAKGYRGFFLDTLDSYQIVVDNPSARTEQAHAIANFIRTVYRRFPGVKLLLNRGFEVLPEVANLIVGVVAESLFHGWDPETKSFRPVSDGDRVWLLEKLKEIQKRYHLPIIVIDYLPPRQRDLARQTAQQIAAFGLIPWVSNLSLDTLGIGAIEIIPRRVLVLYDCCERSSNLSQAQRLAVPLEYLGYAVDYLDIQAPLPDYPLTGRYAGIISWFTKGLEQPDRYKTWFLRQLDSGVPIAILGHPGFAADSNLLERLGLEQASDFVKKQVSFAIRDTLIGFEAEPPKAHPASAVWRPTSQEITVHLAPGDSDGQVLAGVLTAPWGGAALDPYVLHTAEPMGERWIINPFDFLVKALKLPPIPIADVTTEYGRRLVMIQIDGDGTAHRSQSADDISAMEIIRDKILKRYPLPTTVAPIEGEIGSAGLLPKLSPELEVLVKDILALDYVEPASHSYHHLSGWLADQIPPGSPNALNHSLQITDYTSNLRREILDLTAYINSSLAPPGKRVRVFTWEPRDLPGRDALALLQRKGLASIISVETALTTDARSLTRVPSLGHLIDGHFLVFSPAASDTFYTSHWQAPHQFIRVLESFQLTDLPRRLKPIFIHFHFHLASHEDGLSALQQVYAWTMAQNVKPIWVSDYINKIKEFQRFSLARRLDGAWQIRGIDALRTFRLPSGLGWPDLRRSPTVVSVRELSQGRYITLLPHSGRSLLFTHDEPPSNTPYLIQTNADIQHWELVEGSIRFRLTSHVPIELIVAAGEYEVCRIYRGDHLLPGEHTFGIWTFKFQAGDTGEANLICQGS